MRACGCARTSTFFFPSLNSLPSMSCSLSTYCLLLYITLTAGTRAEAPGGRGPPGYLLWWTGIVWNPRTEVTSHWSHLVVACVTSQLVTPWPLVPETVQLIKRSGLKKKKLCATVFFIMRRRDSGEPLYMQEVTQVSIRMLVCDVPRFFFVHVNVRNLEKSLPWFWETKFCYPGTEYWRIYTHNPRQLLAIYTVVMQVDL